MRASFTPLLLALAVTGCGGSDDLVTDTADASTTPEPMSATWLETFDYDWVLFNHRVSYLHTLATVPPTAAVVGGTSTTLQRTELDAACDPDSCQEYPFHDDADVRIGWGQVTTTEARFATGTTSAVVGAAGTTATLAVPDPGGDGTVTAILRGFTVDTDHPLAGEASCYPPGNGWHPRRLAIVLDAPRREGGELLVDVDLAFVAGLTEDPERQCIDEVHERSQVPMEVDVLFVVGPDAQALPIEQGMTYPWNGSQTAPEEQFPPDLLDLAVEAPGMRGWSALDFRFNEHAPTERGAYLRTLVLTIDGDRAGASATNYSPLTQLHDFSYAFTGTVQAIPLEGVTHGVVEASLPTGVDDDGRPVVYTLDGSTPTE